MAAYPASGVGGRRGPPHDRPGRREPLEAAGRPGRAPGSGTAYRGATGREVGMIIHDASNGQLTLITQTDHSNLVGELAAHWGNADFAAPEPYDSVVRAAVFHDYGWLRYETKPLLNS